METWVNLLHIDDFNNSTALQIIISVNYRYGLRQRSQKGKRKNQEKKNCILANVASNSRTTLKTVNGTINSTTT